MTACETALHRDSFTSEEVKAVWTPSSTAFAIRTNNSMPTMAQYKKLIIRNINLRHCPRLEQSDGVTRFFELRSGSCSLPLRPLQTRPSFEGLMRINTRNKTSESAHLSKWLNSHNWRLPKFAKVTEGLFRLGNFRKHPSVRAERTLAASRARSSLRR